MFLFIPEQKEKLTEVEQQSKKAEAAQRRRLQVEKAAKESEVCFCVYTVVCHMHERSTKVKQAYALFFLGFDFVG